MTSNDDRHRQSVRNSVERGNPASSEQERVIYSELDGQPPRLGSIYWRVCNADNLQSSISIASLQADDLRDLGKARRAPGGPEVDDDNFAFVVLESHHSSLEVLQRKLRGGRRPIWGDFFLGVTASDDWLRRQY